MKISLNSVFEKTIWLLTVFLFSSFLIFETYTWGKYAFFAATILIVLLSAISYNGVLYIRLRPYHIFFILFMMYTAITSLWAMRASDVYNKTYSLLQILVCASLMYMHYDRKENIHSLLMAVMWAGYFVVLYAISFYGLDQMLESTQDIRLDTEFSNVNAIAMAAAISCMFQWNEILHRRNIWSSVFMIPAIILITATQSRKAFILLLAGILFVYIVRIMRQKGFAKKILRLLFYVTLLSVAIYFLFRLPIFSGSLERMEQMLNFWSNDGKVDHSTILRNDMMELGLEWFKKHPIGGIGMGNPHILAAQYLKYDAYLHNNFVELLCGGGIIGFVLYYVMYAYLAYTLFKYRNADRESAYLGLIWLVLMLIMNYGMVTYYSKLQWYYLAIHFINADCLKRKHREMIRNAEEPAAQGD